MMPHTDCKVVVSVLWLVVEKLRTTFPVMVLAPE
jgi:hypothetical protein